MTALQVQRVHPITLSRLASDVSWGLMVFQQKGASPQALSSIQSGVLLCDVLQAASSKEVGTGDDAISELQSNLVVSFKKQTAEDVDVEAVVQSLTNFVTPFKKTLENFAGGRDVEKTDEELNDMREFFGQLAVRLQGLGI